MFVQRFKSEGLSHISYFIGQGAEAAVIDPSRDIDAYLELASRTERSIKIVLETHRNEDYVFGSQELASRQGPKSTTVARSLSGLGMRSRTGRS